MFENLREVEGLAKVKVPKPAFDYIAGGANDEATLRENEAAWGRRRLVHRVLRGVASRTLETTVVGTPVNHPILVAPTAFHKLVHPDGEAATARGAFRAKTLFVASTLSTTSLENVAAASPGPKWFQLYIYKDRDLTARLIDRAKAAGYKALVLTADTPLLGRRERDHRNAFTLRPGMRLANFEDAAPGNLPGVASGQSGLASYATLQIDPSITWDDVAWVRRRSGLPVLVKGIVHPDDARRAVEVGAKGIVVSNHGGRQLDHGIATVDALEGVVNAAAGRAEVFVDGGIRRGTDVLVALALGARAVLVGRPVLWGLALDGEAGVERALTMLRDELDLGLALSGLRSVHEVPRDLVA